MIIWRFKYEKNNSCYGVSNVAYVPDGVASVATSNSGVNITGDANHVVVSLVSPAIVGSVGVVGVAVTSIVGGLYSCAALSSLNPFASTD